jgi:hypothetical protein
MKASKFGAVRDRLIAPHLLDLDTDIETFQ